jgi:cell division cycle protein 37
MDEKLRVKLELEKAEIRKQEEEYQRKEKELADKERLQPWNVDTIGKEAWSKSIINKASEKKPAASPKDEEEDSNRMVSVLTFEE